LTDKRPPEPRPTRALAGEEPAPGSGDDHQCTLIFEPKSGMTPLRQRFAQEFVIDLSGAAAYMRASPDASRDTARVEASRLIRMPAVAAEIQRLLDQRATVTGITADRVLMRAWEIATADAREITQIEVGACRFCWGMYNQYQYTEAEFANASDKHIREQAKRHRDDPTHQPTPFPEKGGSGYDPKRVPNGECPECWGDGKQRVVVKDTRNLSPGAAALFAGTRVDKHGNVTVMIEDRSAYLNLVARYLGMDKRVIAGDPENPLYLLLKQIQDQHSTLPVIASDPETEQHALDVVQDVRAKPAPSAGWKPA
jgi:phage terminase small subunit